MIITIDDMRPKYCAWGIRKWFNEHDLDLKAFLENGIDADVLLATGDPLVVEIVERKRNGQGK